jgi:hypothetical protein
MLKGASTGRQKARCRSTADFAVFDGGRTYNWNWENLKAWMA